MSGYQGAKDFHALKRLGVHDSVCLGVANVCLGVANVCMIVCAYSFVCVSLCSVLCPPSFPRAHVCLVLSVCLCVCVCVRESMRVVLLLRE